MAMNPFDIKNVIDKKLPYDDATVAEFNAWIINNAYSMGQNTVLFANEMNQYPFIPRRWAFDFYYRGLPKSKSFDKWIKAGKPDEDVNAVAEYFRINKKRANEYLSLLNEEQLNNIKSRIIKGGRK